jgi:hypothetical protein
VWIAAGRQRGARATCAHAKPRCDPPSLTQRAGQEVQHADRAFLLALLLGRSFLSERPHLQGQGMELRAQVGQRTFLPI